MELQFEFLRLLVSALFGAGLYHFVDKVKTRRTVRAALLSELRTNKALIEDALHNIDRQDNWNGRIGVTFQDEVYNTCRRTTPKLYVVLSNNEPPIVSPYQKLTELNKLQSALLNGFSNLDRENRKQAHNMLLHSKNEIEDLIETIENESGITNDILGFKES